MQVCLKRILAQICVQVYLKWKALGPIISRKPPLARDWVRTVRLKTQSRQREALASRVARIRNGYLPCCHGEGENAAFGVQVSTRCFSVSNCMIFNLLLLCSMLIFNVNDFSFGISDCSISALRTHCFGFSDFKLLILIFKGLVVR